LSRDFAFVVAMVSMSPNSRKRLDARSRECPSNGNEVDVAVEPSQVSGIRGDDSEIPLSGSYNYGRIDHISGVCDTAQLPGCPCAKVVENDHFA
jgi:hypothetical protein